MLKFSDGQADALHKHSHSVTYTVLFIVYMSPSAIPYLHKYIHICVYIYIILCGTFILLSDILSGESRILKRGFQCAHD